MEKNAGKTLSDKKKAGKTLSDKIKEMSKSISFVKNAKNKYSWVSKKVPGLDHFFIQFVPNEDGELDHTQLSFSKNDNCFRGLALSVKKIEDLEYILLNKNAVMVLLEALGEETSPVIEEEEEKWF